MMQKISEPIDKVKCMEIGRSCACFNLRKAARVVTTLYDGYFRQSGLRGTQFSLLMSVKALEPVPMTKLADLTMMNYTTLGRNLKRLEENGLVSIRPAEDRRVREVTLSEKGYETLEKALPLWQKAQTHVMKIVGEKQMNDLLKDLSEVMSLLR